MNKHKLKTRVKWYCLYRCLKGHRIQPVHIFGYTEQHTWQLPYISPDQLVFFGLVVGQCLGSFSVTIIAIIFHSYLILVPVHDGKMARSNSMKNTNILTFLNLKMPACVSQENYAADPEYRCCSVDRIPYFKNSIIKIKPLAPVSSSRFF